LIGSARETVAPTRDPLGIASGDLPPARCCRGGEPNRSSQTLATRFANATIVGIGGLPSDLGRSEASATIRQRGEAVDEETPVVLETFELLWPAA
jgi:hypothetical protein